MIAVREKHNNGQYNYTPSLAQISFLDLSFLFIGTAMKCHPSYRVSKKGYKFSKYPKIYYSLYVNSKRSPGPVGHCSRKKIASRSIRTAYEKTNSQVHYAHSLTKQFSHLA